MERRKFILSSAGLVACAGMSTSMARAAEAAARRAVAGELSAAGFSALLNQQFTVYGTARGATLELVKVKDAARPQPGLRQFTLHFKSETGLGLASGSYELEHASTGRMMMYLDADQRGRDAMLYRADFNLLE